MASLNHQPYKDWLLSREGLTAEQKQALQEHLLTCPDCQQLESAWMQVEAAFKNIPQAAPRAGFTVRWQERLVSQRQRSHRRQGWFFFAVTGGIAALLILILGYQLIYVLRSPLEFLVVWGFKLISLVSILDVLQNLGVLVLDLVPKNFFVILFFFTGFVSLVSVIWAATFRRLTVARRYAS